MSTEKEILIEEIAGRIESSLHISPLAARIYGLLILSPNGGMTFEEIKNALGASKSSISINLNILQHLKYIESQTKFGERKRYFKISRYFQIHVLQAQREELKKDIALVDQINHYHEENQLRNNQRFKSLGAITKNYLHQMMDVIDHSIEEINNHELDPET